MKAELNCWKLDTDFDIESLREWVYWVVDSFKPMGGSHSPHANVSVYLEPNSKILSWSVLTIDHAEPASQEPFLRKHIPGTKSCDYVTKTKLYHAALEPIFKKFPNCFRMSLVALLPKSGYKWHRDLPNYNYRFTLPIIDNTGCLFYIESDSRRLVPDGSTWLINTNDIHRSENTGETTRYHLLWEMHKDDALSYLNSSG